jgi:hypothetical protein
MPGQVTVGCRIPNGIILRAFKMEPRTELLQGGAIRETSVAVPVGQAVTIAGPGRIDRVQRGPVAAGYALTYNVDADVWEAWLAANKNTALVQNKLIIAHSKQVEVSAEARDNEGRISGLEPIDPQGDRRSPAKRQQMKGGAITAIATADRPG